MKRNTLYTLIYYLIACPILVYFMTADEYNGDMCNPGLDLFIFLFAGFITAIQIVAHMSLGKDFRLSLVYPCHGYDRLVRGISKVSNAF